MRCLCLTLIFAAAVMTTVPHANQAAPKPPVPISEQDYDAIMKKVGPAFTTMSKNLDDGDVDRAVKDAQQLSELFAEVEKFWAQHKREDAVKFAQLARKEADAVVTGVGGPASVIGFDLGRTSNPPHRLASPLARPPPASLSCSADGHRFDREPGAGYGEWSWTRSRTRSRW